MKIKLISLTVTILLLISCHKEVENKHPVLSVDISKRDQVSVFDVFEKVELIPLETSRNSLINYISKLVWFKDHYYVFDREAMSILKFDSRGNYIGRIGRMGQGPGEYFNIAEFCIDKNQDTLFILTNLGSIYKYSLEGDFVKNYKLEGDKPFFHDFHIIDSDTLLFWRRDKNEQLHLYSTKARSFIKHLYNKGEEHNFAANVFYEYDGDVFFTRSLSDKVYKLNVNAIWRFPINGISELKI